MVPSGGLHHVQPAHQSRVDPFSRPCACCGILLLLPTALLDAPVPAVRCGELRGYWFSLWEYQQCCAEKEDQLA
jgi:hypothetical protein